jgi:hypothetical protein
MALTDDILDLKFVNQSSVEKGDPREICASKRKIVRSQAMVAVRRRQRLDAQNQLNLRWTAPNHTPRNGSDKIDAARDRDGSQGTITRFNFVTTPPGNSPSPGRSRHRQEDESRTRLSPQRTQVGPPPFSVERFGGGRRNLFEKYSVPFDDEAIELVDHCEPAPERPLSTQDGC